jgi:ketosteroid isomerase-like protein
MKKPIILSFILLSLLSCRVDDNGQAKKEELKTIILDYYNALAKKDLAKANSLTTDNFILFDGGRIYNTQVAIDSVKRMEEFDAVFAIDSLNVHVDKKDASAYYFRNAEFRFAAGTVNLRFLESATFNKIDDKWKLRFIHSTVRR